MTTKTDDRVVIGYSVDGGAHWRHGRTVQAWITQPTYTFALQGQRDIVRQMAREEHGNAERIITRILPEGTPMRITHTEWAGWREGRTARTTGTEVNLFQAQEAGIESDPDAGRWVTVCEPHGQLVLHPTRALAREALSHPDQWCDDCRAQTEAS